MSGLEIVSKAESGSRESDSWDIALTCTDLLKDGERFDILLSAEPESEEELNDLLESNGFYTGQ